MKIIYSLLLFLFIFLWLIEPAYAICPQYYAHIDTIDPPIDCLQIKATRGCGGELEIKNHCDQIFYLEGEKLLEANDEKTYYYHQKVSFSGENIENMKTYDKSWTLRGELGSTPITITGSTAYQQFSLALLWDAIVQAVLSIFSK